MSETNELPPLPEPWADTVHGWAYTADQMRAYARAAIALLPSEAGAPVAWRPGLADIIGAMRNFADVADHCTITEVVNAPASIRTWADMLAELSSTPAAVATDTAEGWVLVPREPTRAMLRAAGASVHPATYWGDAYTAMLAAAPSAQQGAK